MATDKQQPVDDLVRELARLKAENAALKGEIAVRTRERDANLNLAVANGQRAKDEYYRASRTESEREERPRHCGGCGETDPNKRCIGCLADFGPA